MGGSVNPCTWTNLLFCWADGKKQKKRKADPNNCIQKEKNEKKEH